MLNLPVCFGVLFTYLISMSLNVDKSAMEISEIYETILLAILSNNT